MILDPPFARVGQMFVTVGACLTIAAADSVAVRGSLAMVAIGLITDVTALVTGTAASAIEIVILTTGIMVLAMSVVILATSIAVLATSIALLETSIAILASCFLLIYPRLAPAAARRLDFGR